MALNLNPELEPAISIFNEIRNLLLLDADDLSNGDIFNSPLFRAACNFINSRLMTTTYAIVAGRPAGQQSATAQKVISALEFRAAGNLSHLIQPIIRERFDQKDTQYQNLDIDQLTQFYLKSSADILNEIEPTATIDSATGSFFEYFRQTGD